MTARSAFRRVLNWLARLEQFTLGKAHDLGLRAGLVRYRTGPWTAEEWRNGYGSGHLDYFADLTELPRYSLLIGYLNYLGGEPDLLDVGCGQGLLRSRCAGLAFRRYVGIDPTAKAIEKARALEDNRTSFIVGDILDRSLELGSFDVVVCNEVLSVVPDPIAVIERTLELLRPDGHMLTCNWRHPGDEQLWAMIGRHLRLVDQVDAGNPANTYAPRGWRVACYRL